MAVLYPSFFNLGQKSGLGIGLLPTFIVGGDLQQGALTSTLSGL
ncbi:hypothetical protein RintRC_7450 [Richelia intracellularis]|nr:hypothetical protein RintRC_7450 [Richelia intracellularis]